VKYGIISPFPFVMKKKAVCYKCQENITLGGDKTNYFNTSNLWGTRHPDKFRELEEGKPAKRK